MSALRPHMLAFTVLIAVVAGGCGGSGGGGDDDAFGAGDVKRFLIKPSDLPAGYARDFDQVPQADCSPAFRDALKSAGLTSCAGIAYRKKIGKYTNFPGSQVFVLADTARATKALPKVRKLVADSVTSPGTRHASAKALAASGLGDQRPPGVKITAINSSNGKRISVILYVWRSRNAVAFVGGTDSTGDLDAKDYLAIAKALDERAKG